MTITMMGIVSLPVVFSILFFLNSVTLMEKLKQDRSIHNEKILGCVWIVLIFVSLFLALAAMNIL